MIFGLFLIIGITGCSNDLEKYEENLPNLILELIDACWTIKEQHTDERRNELTQYWSKKSGIDDFKFKVEYLCTKEIDGIEKYGIIDVFGSVEQAEFYKKETDSIYMPKAET